MDGRNVKKRRLELGLTQEQVADIAGISRERVSKLERDKNATVTQDTLYGLAEGLQMDPAVLAGRTTQIKEVSTDYIAEEDTVRIDDPDIRLFFSGDWDTLEDSEKEWIKRAIKIAKENQKKAEDT